MNWMVTPPPATVICGGLYINMTPSISNIMTQLSIFFPLKRTFSHSLQVKIFLIKPYFGYFVIKFTQDLRICVCNYPRSARKIS